MIDSIPGFSSDDVISFDGFTIKCSDLEKILKKVNRDGSFSAQFHNLINNNGMQLNRDLNLKWGVGVDCQSLKLNDPVWRAGKLQLRLFMDFIPVEPEPEIPLESPLDEIRQMLDDN
jgi:hypothetical protein